MHQQREPAVGSHGVRCDLEELEICGHLVFRLQSITVPVTDQAALADGICPDCRVPLAGDTETWCPLCHTYWPYDHAAVLGPAFAAAGRMPAASPRGGV